MDISSKLIQIKNKHSFSLINVTYLFSIFISNFICERLLYFFDLSFLFSAVNDNKTNALTNCNHLIANNELHQTLQKILGCRRASIKNPKDEKT